jgi:bacteriocin-like protein
MYELNETELASVVGGTFTKISHSFNNNQIALIDQSTNTNGGNISHSTTSSNNENIVNSTVTQKYYLY